MAKIEKLDDHRKGDKLAAHMALGAEKKSEPVGECLSPDELADVATDYCSAEQKEAALAHFSSCQKCYDAWVAICLSIAAAQRGTVQPKRSLGSVRNLTYLGSAFAIAASVVVFLNVRNVPLEKQIASPPAESVNTSMDYAAPQQSSNRMRLEKTSPQKAPDASAPEALVVEAVEAETETRSHQLAALESVEVDAATGLDENFGAAKWFSGVEEACRNTGRAGDMHHWQGLVEQGNLLLAQGLGQSQQQRIQGIVELLTAMKADGQEVEQCRRILALLAEGFN